MREIARGGMGVVYEAEQRSLGRRVALKVVRGSRFADASEQQRFRAEAEAIARLEHVGIVPVYEVAQHDEHPFYSMAYLPDGSLKELETPMAPRRAAELMTQICDAVHYAHTQNIVHRDLKSANVLLTESLQPRVSDFGLAKDVSEDSDLTRTGAILGTPGFMAPEQASGRNDAVGHLADVYGLGAVLYYLLTGRPPIEGATLVETLHKVVHEDAPDARRFVPELPADLASICRKALEKAPVDRYGSALALGEDLQRFLDGQPTMARPLGGGQRLWRWCARRPALSLLTLVAILGGGVTSYLFALDANDKARELGVANGELQQRNQDLAAARDAASDARAEAESFSLFLVEDVIGRIRPVGRGAGLGVDVGARDLLLASVERIGPRFAGRPMAEALARHQLGVSLRHAGAYEAAIVQLELARDLRMRELGPNDRRTIDAQNSLAASYFAQSRNADAVVIYEDLAERVREHAPDKLPMVLENLAANLRGVERYDALMTVLDQALEVAPDVVFELRVTGRIAVAHALRGEKDEAREVVASLRQRIEATEFPNAYERCDVEGQVFEVYDVLGDRDSLIEVLPGLLARVRLVYGPTSRPVLRYLDLLVQLLGERDRLADAAAVLKVQVEAEREVDAPALDEHGELLARLYMLSSQHVQALDVARWIRDRRLARAPLGDFAFRMDVLTAEILAVSKRRDEGKQLLLERGDALREQVRSGRRGELPELLERFEFLIERL